MQYKLENQSEDDFEKLVNRLCQEILGMGVVSFAKGRDGGRDGRFIGTANKYPSERSQWTGQFIIQAKHTTDYRASCSDNPFFTNQTSIINQEILKIKDLKNSGEIDNYLLFTNRKETAKREEIVKYIKQETGLINVDVVGNETMGSWLDLNQPIAKQFNIGKYELPLTLSDFEIKDIIIAFSNEIPNIRRINEISDEIIVIKKEEKNALNDLTQVYYDNEIRRKSQLYFADIDRFLSDINNEDYVRMYYNFADELSNKITAKRDTFDKFDGIFVYLYDLIYEENRHELQKDRRLISVFLHHLYFNCHIGRTS